MPCILGSTVWAYRPCSQLHSVSHDISADNMLFGYTIAAAIQNKAGCNMIVAATGCIVAQ
jgi:hypothetical protein